MTKFKKDIFTPRSKIQSHWEGILSHKLNNGKRNPEHQPIQIQYLSNRSGHNKINMKHHKKGEYLEKYKKRREEYQVKKS